MANTAQVTKESEIYLGGTRFPIVGKVREETASLLPGKVVFGEYSIADDQIASTLAITDQRGGILVEEMDESIHLDRCWWADLELGYKGHKTLPPLGTSVTIPSWLTPTSTTANSWTDAGNAIDNNTGTYAQETASANSWTSYLQFNITSTYVGGVRYWIDSADEADANLIDIDLYYNSQWNDFYQDVPSFDAWAYATGSGQSGVTAIRIRIYNDDDASSRYQRIHEVDAFAEVSAAAVGSHKASIEFNSLTLFAFDDTICKLNSAGTGIDLVKVLDANITAVSKGTGGNLYWMIGDGANYYWMNTSETFTQAATAYTKCIYWDGKLCAFDSAGAMASSTDPNGAPATWDATVDDNGSLADILDDNDLQGLRTYRDASGDDIKGIFEAAW